MSIDQHAEQALKHLREWSPWSSGVSPLDILRGYMQIAVDEAKAAPAPPVVEEPAYPQWAKDIVAAINEVREELEAIQQRSR